MSLSYQSPPYALFKESPDRLLGNEAFEGFGVELIQGIADFLSKITFCQAGFSHSVILDFNVTLKWVDDGQYGSKNNSLPLFFLELTNFFLDFYSKNHPERESLIDPF